MIITSQDTICLRREIQVTSTEIVDTRTGLIISRDDFCYLQNQLINYIYLNEKIEIIIKLFSNQYHLDYDIAKREFYDLIKNLEEYDFVRVKTRKSLLVYKFILNLYHIDRFKIVTYHQKSILMIIYLMLGVLINLTPYCILLNIILKLTNNTIQLNFYILFYILNILVHEIGHFIAYQIVRDNKYNGYFTINIKKVSYIYIKLKDYRDKIIAFSGPIAGILFNIILLLVDIQSINRIYIYIYILLNFLMILPCFDDGKLIFEEVN